ncbi:MAG: LA2681 family HEPN domain-containing protein [Actinomycetota bacterium]|nr:LA2681 family HEPN domain-containing protein [Actinomycetota bacterium]
MERTVKLIEELQTRDLSPDRAAVSHYFLGNAWGNLRSLSGRNPHDWEQPELEHEVYHHRVALLGAGVEGLEQRRVCQILTNLGNTMSQVGRSVEAVEYWDRALTELPNFSMARGARGYHLSYYARYLHDPGHEALMLKFAHADVEEALSPVGRRLLEGRSHEAFESTKTYIEGYLSTEYLLADPEVEGFTLGDSEEEIEYRRWCLDNRLFLNPLNDLGPYPVAAVDVLVLPTIVTNHEEGPSGPSILGLYNQLKQEFVSARYLYYEGTRPQYTHFSDKDVRLYDTFDHPAYSLAVEKTKISFRMAYSILDKVAFFLNGYLGLGVPDAKVYFRTIWYEDQKKARGLAPAFREAENWPLRGLFWVSKDLFENEPGFRDALEPDARELKEIRHALEHRYLKLHEVFWPGPGDDYGGASPQAIAALKDSLAVSRYRRDFEAKALRLLKLVRASLIYLCLAVHREEEKRSNERDPKQEVPMMRAHFFEDVRKLS